MSNKITDDTTEKTYQYLFSVIIPVYNVERYLAETLDSVINQSIGFENIQIILVNDGSPDNSENICLEYKNKYPENILYVKQENAGVSAARNNGIQYIKGKYVNFLDSDDCWQEDAFEKIYHFFEEHYDETDVSAARKKFFDARTGFHRLDYKYKNTRVTELNEDYEFIQMDVTGSVIKAEAIGEHRFSTHLKYGEDAQFINSILLDKCTLGVVRGAVHLYRKRPDETSALQNELRSESYYFDSPKYFHKSLIEQSKQKYGRVQDFIQYTIMYDLQWRIRKKKDEITEFLSQEDYEKYCDEITEILQQIDDRIIFKQREIYMNMKMFCLSKKYGRDMRKELVYDHSQLMYNNVSTMNFANAKTNIIWFFTEIRNDTIYLEGKDNCWLPNEDYSYYAKVGDEKYYPEYTEAPVFDFGTIYGTAKAGRSLKLEIPLRKGEEQRIEFFQCYGEHEKQIFTSTGKFARIPALNGGYYVKDDYIIRMIGRNIIVYPYSSALRRKFESFYCEQLKKNKRGYLIKYRKLYRLMKRKNKEIWLVSDRTNKANDNGEHMFRYLNKIKPKGIDVYYYIDKNCEDYEKMKKIGKVIPYNTPEYRLYFLLADKILSSSGSEYVINAFGGDRKYLIDLYNFDYIFLQHGVTKDDISEWINRYNKNMTRIVTAGIPEQKSFCEPSYGYSKDVPILSGFPRHDNLIRMQRQQEKEKKVLVIPTWRKSIKGSYDPVTTESIYFEGFKETEYYQFYNSLISDPRLCECMKKNGYKGVLCMHPIHVEQWVDFTPNNVFEINHGYVDYQKEFTTCSLLVTDYSSVFFDFAYLKKPVIYAQFDKEKFFSGEHSYKKGYFSYEDNGFGPVCYDLDSTVKAMITEIENDCKNDPQYIKRIEEFYPYFDENSCQRVYENIIKIPK